MAATRIPWGTVVENAPAVADLLARAKDKWQAGAQHDLEERLQGMEEENRRLEKALLETNDRLRELANSLEVVSTRQKMLAVVTAISLSMAVASLVLWTMK